MKMTDASIVVIDTETTGFDPEFHRICEVGWSRVRHHMGDNDNPEHGFYANIGRSQLINPGMAIPAIASAVHHITDNMVAQSPRIDEWKKHFHADVIVAHNAEFDRAFCVDAGIVPEETPWLCTLRLAKHLLPDAPGHKNQVLRYWLGFEDVAGDAHSAGHDAEVTAMILCHMLNTTAAGGMTVEQLITLAESPILLKGECGFGKYREKTWTWVARNDRKYLQWMARQGPSAWDRDVWYSINQFLLGNIPEEEAT